MSQLRIVVCTLCLLLGFTAQAQTSYWVYFTDKHQCTFDPKTYFAAEAIQRRVLHPIAATDSSDFPVNTDYLNQIAKRVDTLGYASRWLNAVGVIATAKQVEEISKLPFVKRITAQAVYGAPVVCAQPKSFVPDTISGDTIVKTADGEYWPSKQIGSMKGQLFAAENHHAKGIVIAIFDVGFYGVDKHKAFEQVRFNNRIRATFDFYTDNWNVYEAKDDHGTMVLSCMAGIMNGSPMGLATDATFLLARIGKAYSNQYRYEERWMAALEWADKQGVNIINCSG
ncbi:MAG: S8 family serine peptidase, partial [Bacteroidia bacterium]